MFLRPTNLSVYEISWSDLIVLFLYFRKLVSRLKSTGKPITYVDIDIPLKELNSDGIHPV
jgi:hypothetical protein